MESWLPVSLLSRPAALLWKVRNCSFVFVSVQCFVFYGKYHVEIKTQVIMADCFIVEGENLAVSVQCLITNVKVENTSKFFHCENPTESLIFNLLTKTTTTTKANNNFEFSIVSAVING